MANVTLKGFILVPSDKIKLVERELRVHTDLTLKEYGCITFQVTKNEKIPNRFDVYEEFVDRAAFDAHQARVKASYWGKVTVNVERHYEVIEK
ncbi:putative quinol monooxygenase [Vibrio algarum]|uniref:Antibiotic biosynthesis monooxygenase n=1 Tax=Vibrio algarum TaxID=3020714 RepID=A0ABT4YWB0_9VIBR|nr:antibiotic biosynthesis monooxygenase [Vibrio sp. KJ40-1]MDB1125869.1 antibiotic biosynthesis monooxygenase [Vibrio sp. KJ40-1]